MKRIFCAGGLAIACGIGCNLGMASARAETLSLYSLDAPPMTMIEASVGEQAHGFVADIVVEAAMRAGYGIEFQFLPWKRGQEEAARTENALITPLVRTPDREEAYTWVAPIYQVRRSFATLDRPIDSFADARARLHTILVGRGSAQETKLHELGFDDGRLIHGEIGVSDVDMLRLGRVDAWFNSTVETEWKWLHSGETAPLVFGKVLYSDPVYLACAKRCAPELVSRLRAALKTLDEDGTALAIQQRYMGAT